MTHARAQSLLLSIVVLVVTGAAIPVRAQLADPGAKAADKCQRAIAKSGATFAAATAKSLGACFGGVFRCVQTKPGDATCLAKAGARCAKETNAGRSTRLSKLGAGIVGACASLADLRGPDGLGYDALASACAARGAFDDVPAVVDCLRAELECRTERAFAAAMPRARGLATEHAIPLRADSCLDDLGGAGNVVDPKAVGKPLEKCQALAVKAAAGFAAAKQKGLGKCATTIFGCVQTKPGDPKCVGKAAAQCAKVITGAIPAAEAKLEEKIGAGCGAIFGQAGAANAIGVDALAADCQQVGVDPLASAADWGRCVMRRHECAVEAMQPFLAPRFAALLADLGQSATSAFCAGVPTPTPTATPVGTATITPTATGPTASPTPSPAQSPNVVFVSSQTYATTLGSAAAYDTQCNVLATAAGINNGTDDAFIAWISDSSSNAVDRLGSPRGFVRTDGVPIADTVADLTAGKLFHPILLDENGDRVFTATGPMTGTLPSGLASAFTCGNWTNEVATTTVGLLQAGPQAWSSFSTGSCGNVFRVYCFQKTQNAVVAPSPATGKRIFMTATPYAPGSGDPDALCEAEKPAGAGPSVALLATTSAAASAVLDPMTTYVRPDGVAVGTGQAIIEVTSVPFTPLVSGIWQFGDGTYFDGTVWTGSAAVSAVPTSDTCTDWSVTTGSGTTGRSSFTQTGFWIGGTQTCDVGFVRLYCVEQ